jgi:hypothetical protein
MALFGDKKQDQDGGAEVEVEILDRAIHNYLIP